MKKLLFSFIALLMFISVSVAEDGAYFKFGDIEFTYPLANTSVIALYDFWTTEGLIGAETTLVKFQRLNINAGAVTSFLANGMPFISIDYAWGEAINNLPPTLIKLGFWYGRDFKDNQSRAGIKASKPIW